MSCSEKVRFQLEFWGLFETQQTKRLDMGYGTDFLFSGSGLIPSSNSHMYQPPIISQLLHQIPRYNITLHRTNNTFRIRDEAYLEVSFQRFHFSLPFLAVVVFCSFLTLPLTRITMIHQTDNLSDSFRLFFSSSSAEFGNPGLSAGGSFDSLSVRPTALLDDPVLRPETENGTLNHQPQGNAQRRHCLVLCGNRTRPLRQR